MTLKVKTIAILLLFGLHCTAIPAQPNNINEQWKLEVSFPRKELPKWITGSNYNASAFTAVNQKGEIFVLLGEFLQGVSGYVDGKAFLVSPEGKILFQKSDLLPWDSLASIHNISVDTEGHFWVSARQQINDDRNVDFLYRFSPSLEMLAKVQMPLGEIFFRNGQMLLGVNAGTKVLGDSIPYKQGHPFTLLTVDYRTLKITGKQPLPSTGFGVKSFYIPLSDGSFYYVLNTTVLEGPDHHDVHLYYFTPKGTLKHHRQLKGESELTHLYVHEAKLKNGSLEICGFSDSPVDFAQAGKFIGDTLCEFIIYDANGNENIIHLPLKEASKAKDSLGVDYATITLDKFNFSCTYSNKFELLSHSVSEPKNIQSENAENIISEFTGAELGKYGTIKYKIKPGDQDSDEPPVFILYKDK